MNLKPLPWKRKLFFLLSLSLFLTAAGFAQTVTGVVTDATTNDIVPGVNITVKNTKKGTQTDINGKFSINATDKETLVVSFIGYETQEIKVGSQTKIAIALTQVTSALDEVIVVGYGVQKKSQVTGAISSITNKDFKDQPVSNLSSSIQGRVSGMSVTTPSGTPGAGLLISIRGNENPLYVVDGVPMISESNSALSTSFNLEGNAVGNGQSLSSISDINPNDIESIEILKDASATAIYGARAANGVVLITTKRGKTGKTEINFNTYQGVQSPARKIKFMNSQQMVDLIEEGRKNDLAIYKKDPTYFGEGFDPSVLTSPLENFNLDGTNTVWLDKVLRNAPISNYELSARGGDEKTRFFVSGSHFNQTGIVIENYYKRYSFRTNLDHKINNRLNIGVGLSTSYSKNKRSFNDNTYTGIITNALGASPLMPVYDADGNYSAFENYQASWLSDNPVKSAKEIRAFTNTYRLLGIAFAEYTLSPTLKFKSSVSSDVSFLNDSQFKSALTADAQAVGGEAIEANFRATTLLNENTLNWSKINKFDARKAWNILGGVTFQKTQTDQITQRGQGFALGAGERVGGAANILKPTVNPSVFTIMSFIGRANYSFDDRYLATATMRVDGSSRFSKDNRYGYFPSGSIAWFISHEDFFRNKNLSELKIRASYGMTGDQEIGNFQNVNFYQSTRYAGMSGYGIRNIADPTLSWQNNITANIGLDYEIMGGKFYGSIEVYDARKSRLLSQDVVSGVTGFESVTRNSGRIRNRGLEFNINSSISKKTSFKWDINFNFTHNQSKILSLSTDDRLLSVYNDLAPTHILKVGEAMGSLWGIKYLGVDSETGDAKFEDLNGDGIIDNNDAQILGHALPTWFGGVTNNFKYKRFDASIFFRFAAGNKVYNLIRSTYENMGWSNDGGLSSVYANNSTNVLDRWKQAGDKAEYPRASFINSNYIQNSSMYVESGAFVRLQNLQIGYDLSNKKIRNMRVYLQGQNLFVLTKYKGFDPEVSSSGGTDIRVAGTDYGAYPQARTFLLGLNIGL